jgi:hypothetical protein
MALRQGAGGLGCAKAADQIALNRWFWGASASTSVPGSRAIAAARCFSLCRTRSSPPRRRDPAWSAGVRRHGRDAQRNGETAVAGQGVNLAYIGAWNEFEARSDSQVEEITRFEQGKGEASASRRGMALRSLAAAGAALLGAWGLRSQTQAKR